MESTPSQTYTIEEEFSLDPEVENTIAKLRKLEKVCFGSSQKRKYFPDDLGHSKFSQENNPNGDPTLPPRRLYTPRDEKLRKPISTKGYGIGGLSGPQRFYSKSDTPAPNKYNIKENISTSKEHHFPPQVWINYGLVQPNETVKHHLPSERVSDKLTNLWNKCQQIRAPFGNSIKLPRFGKEPSWNLVGPGHYNVRSFDKPHILVRNAFNMGPVELNPRTKIHCAYGPKDSCVECGKELMKTEDYYRARFRIKLPATHEPPIPRNTHEEILGLSELKKVSEESNSRRRRVLLCRNCHCKALRGESRYWKKRRDVEWIFQKARHCGYIHEHNGLPDFTEKTSCYWVKRLQRKEAVLGKYYPDKCEKRIIMRSQQDDK